MIGAIFVDFVLVLVFLIELLISADETGDLIISIVTSPFESLVLSHKLSDVGIAFVNLHFKGIEVLSKLRNSPPIEVSFSST